MNWDEGRLRKQKDVRLWGQAEMEITHWSRWKMLKKRLICDQWPAFTMFWQREQEMRRRELCLGNRKSDPGDWLYPVLVDSVYKTWWDFLPFHHSFMFSVRYGSPLATAQIVKGLVWCFSLSEEDVEAADQDIHRSFHRFHDQLSL